MASVLHKTMRYLGLDQEEDAAQRGSSAYAANPDAYSDQYEYEDYDDPEAEGEYEAEPGAQVMPFPGRTGVEDVAYHDQLALMSKIVTVHPRSPHDAKTVGVHFRQGIPVIMNLTQLEDAEVRRLVDFAAGLAFGLQGDIDRITNKVFLLSPSHVAVSTPAQDGADADAELMDQS